MKFKFNKFVKVSVIGYLSLSLTMPAGSTGWLENFFNDTGTYNNVTSGGAVHGQTMNMYTGGSLFMRVPQKNYQLIGFQPPSISAGCGGIDLFAGSFSFINKEQFVAMLRNIGQASIGHAFMLALKSMAPEVAEVMQYLQRVSQEANGNTLNACQAGQKFVSSTIGDSMLANSRQAADWALALNRKPDALAAYKETRGDRSEAQASIEDARQNLGGVKNPNGGRATPQIFEGNMVWRALTMSTTGLDTAEQRILMSLLGTVILSNAPSGANEPPFMKIKQGTIRLPDVIGSLQTANSASTLKLLTCADGYGSDQCMNVTEEDVPTQSFRALVMIKLDRMRSAMLDRNAQQTNDLAFANYTSLPIQRMLAASTTSKWGDISQSLNEKWGDVAAAEYAAAFIRHGIDILERAISQAKTNSTQLEADQLAKLEARLVNARSEVLAELRTAYSQGEFLINISRELEWHERTMRSGFSQQTNAALSFGRDRASAR